MDFLKRGAVRDVSFSPDGRSLAVGMSTSLVLLDTMTWQVLKSWSREGWPADSVAYSPKGDVIASTYKDQVVIVDVDGKRKERYLNGHKGLVCAVGFHPNGRMIMSGGEDGTVILWELKTGKLIRRFKTHSWWVSCVDISRDGETFLSAGGWDGIVFIRGLPKGSLISTIKVSAGVADAAFSPDGRTIALAWGGRVGIWDIKAARFKTMMKLGDSKVNSIIFSPDGRWLATATGWECDIKGISVWDLAKQRIAAKYNDPWPTMAVAFSPDGRSILSGCWGGKLHIRGFKGD